MMSISCLNCQRILCAGIATVTFISRILAADALPRLELRDAYPALKLNRPIWMEESPDGSQRRFVVEQAGKIWILPPDRNGTGKDLFLDITDRRPLAQNEEGG